MRNSTEERGNKYHNFPGIRDVDEYFPTHCSALSQALCKTALSGQSTSKEYFVAVSLFSLI